MSSRTVVTSFGRLALASALLVLLLGACTGLFGPAPTATEPPSSGSTPAPTATPTSTEPGQPLPTPTESDGATLEIFEPSDGAVLRMQAAPVRGRAEPDSTVTVNGSEADLDRSGDFLVAVFLSDGANRIEVTVRDSQGRRRIVVLNVTYEPCPDAQGANVVSLNRTNEPCTEGLA